MFGIEYFTFFLVLLAVVAFLYAAVGHGGASGYLALMALFGFSVSIMKPTALLLNLFVAAIAFVHYARAGHFKLKLFLPFAMASIPAAFLGGLIEVNVDLYKKILGILLVFAVMRMLGIFDRLDFDREIRQLRVWQGLSIGGVVGFFSGLIGIGGGIILSPIILLCHWGNAKQTAAVSALFIWANSAAALVGVMLHGAQLSSQVWLLVLAAVLGGFLGGLLGSRWLSNKILIYLLATVLGLATLKLLFT